MKLASKLKKPGLLRCYKMTLILKSKNYQRYKKYDIFQFCRLRGPKNGLEISRQGWSPDQTKVSLDQEVLKRRDPLTRGHETYSKAGG